MKLSARLSQLLTLLIITSPLLTASAFAGSKLSANDKPGTAIGPASAAITIKNSTTLYTHASILAPPNIYASLDDRHALRSNRFNLPDPLRCAVSSSAGFAQVIRRPLIRRKGNLQH